MSKKEKLPRPMYFRCMSCRIVLNHKMLEKGICLGHRISEFVNGTVFERLKVRWWKFTGQ